VRILIADDHSILRQGLKRLLAEAIPNAEFGEAGSYTEALTLATRSDWDLVLADITMPGRSGLDLLKELKSLRPNLPVLVLSMHAEDQFAVRAIKAGAAGYLKKDCSPAELVRAVNRAAAGGRYVSEALAERLAVHLQSGGPNAPHEQLSDREFVVLRLIASGKSMKEIAAELGLSINTVNTYRARMLNKLDLKTNVELTRFAVDHELV